MTITGSDFDAPFEALFDRTAYLNRFVPDVQVFVANTTWTKPADAAFVDFLLVGGGGGGGGAEANEFGGAGGGSSGVVSRASFSAVAVPATLYVYPGDGGAGQISNSPTLSAGDATVVNSDASASVPGSFWLRAAGGEGGTCATPGYTGAAGGGTIYAGDYVDVVQNVDSQYRGGAGGNGDTNGGTAQDGDPAAYDVVGQVQVGEFNPSMAAATGGLGATTDSTDGEGGPGGVGYGGGGGGAGGGGSLFTARGGGGGAGAPGLLSSVSAIDGASQGYGGGGADGAVIIISWRAP